MLIRVLKLVLFYVIYYCLSGIQLGLNDFICWTWNSCIFFLWGSHAWIIKLYIPHVKLINIYIVIRATPGGGGGTPGGGGGLHHKLSILIIVSKTQVEISQILTPFMSIYITFPPQSVRFVHLYTRCVDIALYKGRTGMWERWCAVGNNSRDAVLFSDSRFWSLILRQTCLLVDEFFISRGVSASNTYRRERYQCQGIHKSFVYMKREILPHPLSLVSPSYCSYLHLRGSCGLALVWV